VGTQATAETGREVRAGSKTASLIVAGAAILWRHCRAAAHAPPAAFPLQCADLHAVCCAQRCVGAHAAAAQYNTLI
jgi:hypothetical protein